MRSLSLWRCNFRQGFFLSSNSARLQFIVLFFSSFPKYFIALSFISCKVCMHGVGAHAFVAFVCFPKHSGTSKQVCFFLNLISRIDKKITGVIHHTPTIGLLDIAWGCGGGIWGSLFFFLSRFLAFFVTFRPCLRQPPSTETAPMAQIDHMSLYDGQAPDALQRYWGSRPHV